MFEVNLDAVVSSNEQERQQIIAELVKHPNETLDAILKRHHGKSKWSFVIELIRRIGYPQNSRALPWLVDHIDRNSPAWDETIRAIADLEPEVVTPYLIEILWDRGRHRESWGYDVESICVLLCQLDRAYAAWCGPVLAYLLTLKVDPAKLDPAFLLDALEKVGDACAVYALPCLIEFIERERQTEAGKQALRLIATLKKESLAPYTAILPFVQSDGSKDAP